MDWQVIYIYRLSKLSYIYFRILFLACTTMPTLANGQVKGNEAVVFLTCNDGYLLVGPEVLSCQKDGTWPKQEANCTGELF